MDCRACARASVSSTCVVCICFISHAHFLIQKIIQSFYSSSENKLKSAISFVDNQKLNLHWTLGRPPSWGENRMLPHWVQGWNLPSSISAFMISCVVQCHKQSCSFICRKKKHGGNQTVFSMRAAGKAWPCGLCPSTLISCDIRGLGGPPAVPPMLDPGVHDNIQEVEGAQIMNNKHM